MPSAPTPQSPDAAIATLQRERDAALAREAALAEVLAVINRSSGDPAPVFAAILAKAHELCGAASGTLALFDGTHFKGVATHGLHPDHAARMRQPFRPNPRQQMLIDGARCSYVEDLRAVDLRSTDDTAGPSAALTGTRTLLAVPLRKDGAFLGFISANWTELRPFAEAEATLLENFAAQAVIAMENARLLTEQQEALQRQTATAEVLQVINASPGNLAPVFDAILEKAHLLCDAPQGSLDIYDGQWLRTVAVRGFTPEVAAILRIGRRPEAVPDLHMFKVSQNTDQTERLAEFPDDPALRAAVETGRTRTRLSVPLVKDGVFLGRILAGRQEVRAFTERQISLLESFAAQAVIAMENARLLDELRTRDEQNRKLIARQAASIEILRAISDSPDDPQPVFDLIVRRGRELCNAAAVGVHEFDGRLLHLRAMVGYDPESAARLRAAYPRPPGRESTPGRVVLSGEVVHIPDIQADVEIFQQGRGLGTRTALGVPILSEGRVIGAIWPTRFEVRRFDDGEIALLQSFAEQAAIAIASAKAQQALRTRTEELARRNSEFGERIDQQAATIDVLKVMSASPDDTQPVFDQIVRRARELCNARGAGLFEFDGELMHFRATCGPTWKTVAEWVASEPEAAAYVATWPMPPARGSITSRAILDREIVHIRDMRTEPGVGQTLRDLRIGSQLSIPLLRDGVAIGAIMLGSTEPGGFTDSQVELLKTFAEQAVIAIGSVATYRKLRERTAELTRSVAELQALEEVLRAVNSSLDLETVLATIISRAVQLSQADEGTIYEFDATDEVFVPKSAFGMTEERIARVRERRIRMGETHVGRSAELRAPVQVDDVQNDSGVPEAATLLAGIHAVLAVPLLREDAVVGGLVIRRRTEGAFAPATVALMQTFAAQSVLAIENARLFEAARHARAASDAALADLRRAQDRLVQTEKMASLGQLTAGIAHEIKNPLNFVNNFSELSTELIDDLREALAPAPIDQKLRGEIDDLTGLLKSNLEKVVQHGKRADGIVKNMLLHSREGGGEQRSVDLNAIVEEALNLAYHGARAEKPGFDISLVRDFDPAAGSIDLYPQEFTRVILNLVANGFYAATRKGADGAAAGFEPTVTVSTRAAADAIAIRIRDNGNGISETVRAKMFEPFFTTKPAGEGTGLGLSLSHDIVVKQHGGTISVDSAVGHFTEITVTLPRPAPA